MFPRKSCFCVRNGYLKEKYNLPFFGSGGGGDGGKASFRIFAWIRNKSQQVMTGQSNC